ncbi:hypothetical protein GQX74_003988 [Glossina fuscipes]|nr:hypothetical protein GQX74_003988 [Glossina fuscipes]
MKLSLRFVNVQAGYRPRRRILYWRRSSDLYKLRAKHPAFSFQDYSRVLHTLRRTIVTVCITFCDDVAMPSKDTYGSQPPLELLRQWLDHGYWSDLIDTTKIELVDMVAKHHRNSPSLLQYQRRKSGKIKPFGPQHTPLSFNVRI